MFKLHKTEQISYEILWERTKHIYILSSNIRNNEKNQKDYLKKKLFYQWITEREMFFNFNQNENLTTYIHILICRKSCTPNFITETIFFFQ